MIHCIAFRHGQTDWNKQELIQGHSDISINRTGVAQAQETKKKVEGIHVDIIYSSDLIRCIETAKIIFPRRKIITTSALREINFGKYDGQNRWKVREESSLFNEVLNNLNHPLHLYTPFPQGESAAEAFSRLLRFLIALDNKSSKQNIALFSHGDLLELVFEMTQQKISEIKHGSCFEFDFDAQQMQFTSFKF